MENTNIVKGTVQLICAKQKGTNCLAYLCRALVAKNKKSFLKFWSWANVIKNTVVNYHFLGLKYCSNLPPYYRNLLPF
jgi:hypothetical protein